MMISESLLFEQQVEDWVYQSIISGVTNFDSLIRSLPGVYPSVAISALKRLVTKSRLTKSLVDEILSSQNCKQEISDTSFHLDKNITHPLDYDWRFTKTSTNLLLEQAHILSKKGDTIALLGTPSIFFHADNYLTDRKIILFDKNPTHADNVHGNSSCYTVDLLHDSLPNIQADVVIADPPWYPEHMLGFVWAASKLCKVDSHMLISLPRQGTRPKIINDLYQLLNFAYNAGFGCLTYEHSILSYRSPLFENNALLAEGINSISHNWRTASLAIFYRHEQKLVNRPIANKECDKWIEVKIRNVGIRLKYSDSLDFLDPTLNSIVDGNILPSVSRRDVRVPTVDVWTTGNRVFSCKGTNIVLQILYALEKNIGVSNAISNYLNRELNKTEHNLIKNCVKNIINLIHIECAEQLKWKNDK